MQALLEFSLDALFVSFPFYLGLPTECARFLSLSILGHFQSYRETEGKITTSNFPWHWWLDLDTLQRPADRENNGRETTNFASHFSQKLIQRLSHDKIAKEQNEIKAEANRQEQLAQ